MLLVNDAVLVAAALVALAIGERVIATGGLQAADRTALVALMQRLAARNRVSPPLAAEGRP